MNGALPADNIYYYISYVVILVAFYFVLKSPKKGDENSNDKKDNDNKDEK